MHIAHITTIQLTAKLFLKPHFQYALRNGWRVSLISSNSSIGPAGLDSFDVDYREVALTRTPSPLRDLRALVEIIRELRSLKPDVVHAHTPKAALLGLLAAWICRVPTRIYHIHGLPTAELPNSGTIKAIRALEKITCRFATRVLCVSESVRRLAVQEGYAEKDRTTVPACGSISGIDVNHFDPELISLEARTLFRKRLNYQEDQTVALVLGRFAHDKGASDLTELLSHLEAVEPDIRVLWIGPTDASDPVSEATAATLASNHNFQHIEWEEDVRAALASVDIVLSLSKREGFPVSLLEAGAMMRPVVGYTATGVCDAVVDGHTGHLCTPGDTRQIAVLLERYAKSPRLSTAHGLNARRRAERDFNQEVVVTSTASHYRTAPQC